jgi:polysaccharide biosynthesis protein PslG
MRRHGDEAKDIWLTEFGWSSHPNTGREPDWMRGVSLQQQADYTVRAIRLVRASYPYVTNMLVYNDRNRTSGNVHLDNYGVLYYDVSEKPLYRALRAAAQPSR